MVEVNSGTIDAMTVESSGAFSHESVKKSHHKQLDPCPHCGKTDFYSAAQRGSHMFFVHHIPGKSTASVAAKQKRTEKHSAKPASRKRKHESVIENPVETKHAAHVIHLIGYITCYLELYCRGNEIPEKLIASRVGEGLLAQTRR